MTEVHSKRSARRPRHTDEKLKKISEEHLLYEIQMLFGVAWALRGMVSDDQTDIKSWAVRNALIESFTVHARNLLGFLYSENARPDDVIAEDFFDSDAEWKNQRPIKSQILTQVHKRVGKEIAHLTYSRLEVTPEAKQWHFVEISNQILKVLERFLELVPSNRISPSFEKLLDNFSDTLAKQMGISD